MKNIVLTGFMGTGKSTVGRRLARVLKYSFLDVDEIIEQESGSTVRDIFAAHGEDHFRELERGVIRKLVSARKESTVTATGGGAVADASNRAALRGWATVVCLRASTDAILERVGAARDRPLLGAPGRKEAVEKLLAQRDEAYRDCDLTVDTTGKTVEEVVAIIMDYLSKKGELDK